MCICKELPAFLRSKMPPSSGTKKSKTSMASEKKGGSCTGKCNAVSEPTVERQCTGDGV